MAVCWTHKISLCPFYASVTPFEVMRTDSLLGTGSLKAVSWVSDVCPPKPGNLRQNSDIIFKCGCDPAIHGAIPFQWKILESFGV